MTVSILCLGSRHTTIIHGSWSLKWCLWPSLNRFTHLLQSSLFRFKFNFKLWNVFFFVDSSLQKFHCLEEGIYLFAKINLFSYDFISFRCTIVTLLSDWTYHVLLRATRWSLCPCFLISHSNSAWILIRLLLLHSLILKSKIFDL